MISLSRPRPNLALMHNHTSLLVHTKISLNISEHILYTVAVDTGTQQDPILLIQYPPKGDQFVYSPQAPGVWAMYSVTVVSVW